MFYCCWEIQKLSERFYLVESPAVYWLVCFSWSVTRHQGSPSATARPDTGRTTETRIEMSSSYLVSLTLTLTLRLTVFPPADNFRPYITSFQGNNCTDYINAVFVDVSVSVSLSADYLSLTSRATPTPGSTSWPSGPWSAPAATSGLSSTTTTAPLWWCSATLHQEWAMWAL